MTRPLAVGLMPTFNRPAMAHRAMHMFLGQDYRGPTRLVVFDDGDLPALTCGVCADHVEIVRCFRVNLPTKRNMMMQHVGDTSAIYFMWDDDDFHGPRRLSRQIAALEEGYGGCLMRPTLYYNEITEDLRMSSWISDATIAYRWSFWQKRRFFEGVDPGSGRLFVSNRHDLVEQHGELNYCTVVHAGQRHTPPAFGEPDFTHAPVSPEWIKERLRMP